jgi:uncharacterized membrane protein
MTQDDINQNEWNDPKNWSTLTYSSRIDSRIFVPKRRGFGLTMNFGHKSGKIVFPVLIVLPLVILGIVQFAGFHLFKK